MMVESCGYVVDMSVSYVCKAEAYAGFQSRGKARHNCIVLVKKTRIK